VRSEPSPARAPTGEQVELVRGEQRLCVVEVGAGIRRYAVGERELLDGYGMEERCRSGRGQLLLPWPNRIDGGTYAFAGEEHTLALTEPSRGNAIHGLVRWSNWRIGERSTERVTLTYVLHAQPGYPHVLELEVGYALDAGGLTVTTSATNVGTAPCPFGTGAHPYVTFGRERVDDVVLRVPARTRLLERDDDGRARIALRAGDDATTVWLGERYRYAMVFTGDPLPDVDRRSVAVEPMTCAPNAFRSGDGLLVLEPGETFRGAWGIELG